MMNLSTNAAQPFAFDTEFASDGGVIREGNQQHKKYSVDEVEAERSAARQEGETSAVAQAEAQVAQSVSDLANRIGPLVPELQSTVEQLRKDSLQLALALAKQMAGRALERFPDADLQAVLKDADTLFPKGPSVHIVVPEGLAGRVQASYSGEAGVVFVEDANAQPGEWRVEWDSGGILRDQAAVTQALEAIIEKCMQDESGQADLFSGVA